MGRTLALTVNVLEDHGNRRIIRGPRSMIREEKELSP